MILGLEHFRPIRNAMRIFSAERSPRQVAAAIALGSLIGILPKGNLLTVAFSVVMFSLRINLGVGLSAIFLVSLASPQIAPFAHEIGIRAFQMPVVYRTIERIYDWPLVPWTALNNTLVLGSTLLGLVLVYPIYHVSHAVLARVQPAWRRWRTGEVAAQLIPTGLCETPHADGPTTQIDRTAAVTVDNALRTEPSTPALTELQPQTYGVAPSEPFASQPCAPINDSRQTSTPSEIAADNSAPRQTVPVDPVDRPKLSESHAAAARAATETSQQPAPMIAADELARAESPIGPRLRRAIEEGRRALQRNPLRFDERPTEAERQANVHAALTNETITPAVDERTSAGTESTATQNSPRSTPLFTRKPAAKPGLESTWRDVA